MFGKKKGAPRGERRTGRGVISHDRYTGIQRMGLLQKRERIPGKRKGQKPKGPGLKGETGFITRPTEKGDGKEGGGSGGQNPP